MLIQYRFYNHLSLEQTTKYIQRKRYRRLQDYWMENNDCNCVGANMVELSIKLMIKQKKNRIYKPLYQILPTTTAIILLRQKPFKTSLSFKDLFKSSRLCPLTGTHCRNNWTTPSITHKSDSVVHSWLFMGVFQLEVFFPAAVFHDLDLGQCRGVGVNNSQSLLHCLSTCQRLKVSLKSFFFCSISCLCQQLKSQTHVEYMATT